MIHPIITQACPRCGSDQLVRNGHDYKGVQKFRCKTCNRYGTLKDQRQSGISKQACVEHAFTERVSLRGIARIFKFSRTTVDRWLTRTLEPVPALIDTLLARQLDDVLELDELWSFVGSKAEPRWVWVALCRRTRHVVANWIGDRSETSAIRLWEQLPDSYRRCYSFSDQWQAYRYVFDHKRHR